MRFGGYSIESIVCRTDTGGFHTTLFATDLTSFWSTMHSSGFHMFKKKVEKQERNQKQAVKMKKGLGAKSFTMRS